MHTDASGKLARKFLRSVPISLKKSFGARWPYHHHFQSVFIRVHPWLTYSFKFGRFPAQPSAAVS